MPIPPYIGQKRAADEKDETDYQTTYSRALGSVATPTAWLHFRPELMHKIKQMGAEVHFITLHVGAGTFLPVKTDEIDEHLMHEEWFEISQPTANGLNQAKRDGRRVIAIGTTSLRAIECAVDENGMVRAGVKSTAIFIYPSKIVHFIDAIISNFHLPKSTLLMLMCAFSGTECVKSAYQTAIKEKYRFFSYGDAGFWIKAGQ